MQAEKQIINEPSSVARKNAHFILGTALIALLLFVYYFYTWRNAYNFRSAIDTCAQSFCDFADYYYPMGETILQTKLPIEGFVYSPFIAILLAVFPPLGLDASLFLWGILQVLFIILYLFAFRRLVPARLPFQLLFIALTLSSFPLLHSFKWGQVGVFTTVSILGMLVFVERDRRAFAAALLAFAASFKFFPLIFILPFVFRRDSRFLLHAVFACGIFLIAVPCLLLGIGGTLNFYSILIDSYRHFDWVITNYNSQYFPHVFLRLGDALGMDAGGFLPLVRWISYGITAINIGLVYLIQRAQLQDANLWSFHIIFLSIPFVLLTSWPADLVYISFAQGLLVWRLSAGNNPPARISWRNAAFMLVFASMIVSSIFFFNLIGDHNRYGSIGFIFWSNMLLLAASYLELLPSALRRLRVAPHGSAVPDRAGEPVRTAETIVGWSKAG